MLTVLTWIKKKQIHRNTTNQILLVFLEYTTDGKIIRKQVFHTRDSSANYADRVHTMIKKYTNKYEYKVFVISCQCRLHANNIISFCEWNVQKQCVVGKWLPAILIRQFVFLHALTHFSVRTRRRLCDLTRCRGSQTLAVSCLPPPVTTDPTTYRRLTTGLFETDR